MNLRVTVEIIEHGEVSSYATRTGSKFQKFLMVGRTLGEHPKEIAFEVFNQRINPIKQIAQIGKICDIKFYIESRNWQNRWFTTAVCTDAEVVSNAQSAYNPQQAYSSPRQPQQERPTLQASQVPTQTIEVVMPDDESLPF